MQRPAHEPARRRAKMLRSSFLFIIVAGVVVANLLGVTGFWLRPGATESEIRERYAEDAREYDRQWEQLRGQGVAFFEYSAVKQSRVHGWPFPCVWCDVMTEGAPDGLVISHRSRATPWLSDGARVFEVRFWPTVIDLAFVVGIITSVRWVSKHREWKWQFTLTALLAVVLGTAVVTWSWMRREPFQTEVEMAGLLRPLGAAIEGSARVGWYFAILTTFIGVNCAVLGAMHFVAASRAGRGGMGGKGEEK
jgi:hypothetical protein